MFQDFRCDWQFTNKSYFVARARGVASEPLQCAHGSECLMLNAKSISQLNVWREGVNEVNSNSCS